MVSYPMVFITTYYKLDTNLLKKNIWSINAVNIFSSVKLKFSVSPITHFPLTELCYKASGKI